MLDFFVELFNQIPDQWAFLGVIGILMICGLGIPLPEEIPLFIAGYLVYREVVDLHTAYVGTLAAILIGDSVLHWVGRTFGQNIFKIKWFSRMVTPRHIRKVNVLLRRYGNRVVFVARFLTGLRGPIFLSTGILRMPYRRFILFDAMAAVISAPLIIWMTYKACVYFGGSIEDALQTVRRTEKWLMLGVPLAVMVISYLLYRWQKRRRKPRQFNSCPQTLE